jgi:hypothetical protein
VFYIAKGEKQIPRLVPRPRQIRARLRTLAALPRDDRLRKGITHVFAIESYKLRIV